MFKQFFINRYFNKITTEEFFRNDDEAVIGKAKDVIEQLKSYTEDLKKKEDEFDLEELNIWITENEDLINNIEQKYHNKNDVIGIYYHPMAGTFLLQDKDELYEELKEYYKEMKEEEKNI